MKFKTSVVACVVLLGLGACSQGYEPRTDINRTETGAVIGGVIGGLIGLRSDNNKLAKGAVGAAIGAAAGGVIGQQLDKQAADLRRDIPNPDIGIENTGTELRVSLPQNLLFEVDSANVSGSSQNELYALAENLQSYPDSTVSIVGHTDDTGSDDYNFELSERRAGTVQFILQDAGVSGERLVALGRGETQPVASNTTEAGRAQNRRVEIVIRPNAV